MQCTATVLGQKLSPAVAAFTVTRPNAVISAKIKSQVAVDNNWDPAAIPALHFGYNKGTLGINFYYTTDTAGNYQWVQVGHSEAHILNADDGKWYKALGDGVDTFYPYTNNTALGITLKSASDSPGFGPLTVDPEVKRSDLMTMHLMFQPFAGIHPQWVPLRKINWSWSGDAILTSNVWALAVGNPSPQCDPADANETQYPIWTSNITNTFNNNNFQPQ